MTIDFLYNFIQKNKYAVVSTVSPNNIPESACVGIAVSKDLEIIFDTVNESRKYKNLLLNPNVSFVLWEGEKTIQYEGVAKIPTQPELNDIQEIYFAKFPEGRDRKEKWGNIAYILVKPNWIRFSDFTETTPQIEEMIF